MASLLYRIGRFSARRAWLIVVAWLAVLGLAGGAFALFGGSLSSSVSIPGTPTQQVSDELGERFPSAGGGTGSVTFTSAEDAPLSENQRADITALLERISERDGVSGTVNPFATQRALEEQGAQLEAGREAIARGAAELDAAQAQLDGAAAQLDAGQAQIEAAREQASQAGMLGQMQAQLAAMQERIDAGRAETAAAQERLTAGRAELETNRAALDNGAQLLALTDGIRQVSEDGTSAVGMVQFEDPLASVPAETKSGVVSALNDAEIDGVRVAVSVDLSQSIPKILGIGEAVGVVIAAITLFIMLGTLIGAGLPLINALVGVGVGVLVSLSLSGAVEMISVTPVLGVMLGLAVGIDYSLFILNRHRLQLRDGVALQESIRLANGTAGNAVVFAGATVIIALLALNVTGIPFLGMMGTVGAICILAAILVAITLTPALLSLVGMRILPRKARAALAPHREGAHAAPMDAAERGAATHGAVRAPAAPMRTARAVLTLVVGVIALLIVAIPSLSMRLGLPAGSSEPVDSSAYRAFSLVEEKFGAGMNGPLLVVARMGEAVAEEDLVAEQVRIGTELRSTEDVVAIAPVGLSEDSMLLAFQVIPEEGPSSESTEQLVRDLRGLEVAGVDAFGVAGNASGNIDVSEKLAAALPLYLLVVMGLSILILILVFRSILVPLTATLGFALSLFATFGAITAIFQWGWLAPVFGVHDPGPILSFLPILVVGILFGLAMDYQLFLVTGMHEAHARGIPARLAVRRGVNAGRTVVVAAAIIMISVFGGFVSSDSVMIQSIGFALAFGVLVDAFVVRLLLIPAVMHLLGESAWWIPRWLDRILPNVDVEGSSLARASVEADAAGETR